MKPIHTFNGDTLTTHMQDAPAVYWMGNPTDVMYVRTELNANVFWTSDMLEEAKQEHVRELNEFYVSAQHV